MTDFYQSKQYILYFLQFCLIFSFTVIITLVWTATVLADGPGNLDTSFNSSGIVTNSFSTAGNGDHAIAIQPDGKIVVTGSSNSHHFTLLRYQSNGGADLTFNGTGLVTTPLTDGGFSRGHSVAIQPDGKIVVAGSAYHSEVAVLRYQDNGELDPTFNNGTGMVITPIGDQSFGNSLALQSNGKIVVAGSSLDSSGTSSNFAVVRYQSDGQLDPTFNGTGIVTTSISYFDVGFSVAIQADGKIVVAGYSDYVNDRTNLSLSVVRYQSNGQLDPTFNGTGLVTATIDLNGASGHSVAIQPDGKIVVAGTSVIGVKRNFAVVRYQSDGQLDPAFNGTGVVTTSISNDDQALSVAIQPNGKIVVAGHTDYSDSGPHRQFTVVRYHNDGRLDATFNGSGVVTTPLGIDDISNSIALQTDGKIAVAGNIGEDSFSQNLVVVRYEGDRPIYLPVVLKD